MVSGQQQTGPLVQKTQGDQVLLTRLRGRCEFSGSSSFEAWLEKIQSHECPSVLSAEEYMTSRNKSLLRQLITFFRNNTRLQVLYLQGLGIDDELLRDLIDILETTTVYGVNLGESEYSVSALQYFVDRLPYTYVVQVYFQNVSITMKNNILTACEHNRGKVQVLQNLY